MRTYNRLQPPQRFNVSEVRDLCRLCMNVDTSMCDIFTVVEGNRAASLPAKILKCLSIEVEDDNRFPTKVCASCLKSVNAFAEFWEQCHTTNKKLQHLIENTVPGLSEAILQSPQSYSGYDELYKSPEHSLFDTYEDEETTTTESAVSVPSLLARSSSGAISGEFCNSVPNASSKDLQELSGELSSCAQSEGNLFETHIDAAADASMQLMDMININEESNGVEVQVSMNGNSYVVKVLHPSSENKTETALEEVRTIGEKCSQISKTLPVSQDKIIFECTSCQESFKNSSDLKNHVKTHKNVKGFSCKLCSKWFSLRSGLVRHERIHSGERPYKCVECSKSFSQKEVLRRHVLIHSGNKPYKCDSCDKSYTQKEALRMHIKNNHVPKKYVEILQYQCPLCEKSFCHLSGLSRHQQSHAGKKYPCTNCDRVFTDQSSLRRHNQRVHNSSIKSDTNVQNSTNNTIKQINVTNF